MLLSSQWECRNVLLEKWKFDAGIDELVDCGQCGVILSCKEAFGGHLKSFHFALVVSNVGCEMCILVAFLSVSLFNILLRGACELKQVFASLFRIKSKKVTFPASFSGMRQEYLSSGLFIQNQTNQIKQSIMGCPGQYILPLKNLSGCWIQFVKLKCWQILWISLDISWGLINGLING